VKRVTNKRIRQTLANLFSRISVSFLVLPIIGFLSIVNAAEIPAISEKNTFGVVDEEFSMNGLLGLYRWNVERNWTGEKNLIREDNTFGIESGEFTVNKFIANTRNVFFEKGFAQKESFEPK
jgi:hypothetical protein